MNISALNLYWNTNISRIFLYLATNAAVLVIVSGIYQLVLLLGFIDARNQGLILAIVLISTAIIGIAGSLYSLFLSTSVAKATMDIQLIRKPETEKQQCLLAIVHKQAGQVGIKTPEIGIFESPKANAFTTGTDRNNALLCVSSGLLHYMNTEELEAVIGHEITHIANGDMVTLALMQGVVNTFVFFFASIVGHFIDHLIFQTKQRYGLFYFIVQIIAQISIGFLASLLVMWFSRNREFKADAGGAVLAGNKNMINALQVLQSEYEPYGLPGHLEAFGIRSSKGSNKLFMSHPSIKTRIIALENSLTTYSPKQNPMDRQNHTIV